MRKHAGETKTTKEQQQQQAKTHTREMKAMKDRFQQQHQQQQQQAKRHAQEMKAKEQQHAQKHAKQLAQHQSKLQEQAASHQATATQHVCEVAQWQKRLRSAEEELLAASTVPATVSVGEQVAGLAEDALERLEHTVRVERQQRQTQAVQRAREEARAEAREEARVEAHEARSVMIENMRCSVCMDAPKNCTLNCGICTTISTQTHTS